MRSALFVVLKWKVVMTECNNICSLRNSIESYRNAFSAIQRSIGEINPASRLSVYEKSAEKIESVFRSGFEAGNPVAHESITALYEMAEIGLLFDEVTNSDAMGMKESLEHASKGPVSYNLERPAGNNSKARNALFELCVGARLRCLGLIDFSTVSDVVITDGEHRYFVECKRPFSLGSINSNFGKANSQLVNRFKNRECSRNVGIIAIDLSKAINPSFDFLVVESVKHVDGVVSQLLGDLTKKHIEYWRANAKAGVGFVLLRYSGLVRAEADNAVVYVQRYALVGLCSESALMREASSRIIGALNKKPGL